MTRRKAYEFEVTKDGAVVFAMTVPTKAQKFDGMRDCMRHVDSVGGQAIIRCRSITSRDWSYWSYAAGASHANSVRPSPPSPVASRSTP